MGQIADEKEREQERREGQLRCGKCGHEWRPRIDERPKCCPACKSYKWDDTGKIDGAV